MPGKKKVRKKTTFSLGSILKKRAIDSNGGVIGSVEDIIVTVGGDRPEALLSIRDAEGKETQISFTDIASISEVVLLSKVILKGAETMKPAEAFAPAKPEKIAAVPTPPPPPTPSTSMKCTKCGFENTPGSKFCIMCGNSLA